MLHSISHVTLFVLGLMVLRFCSGILESWASKMQWCLILRIRDFFCSTAAYISVSQISGVAEPRRLCLPATCIIIIHLVFFFK